MKKINKLLFVGIMGVMVVFMPKVSAKTLTIDEVVNSVKNTESLKKLNDALEDDEKMNVVLSDDKSTLKFTGKDFEMTFNVLEDYLEYSNREVEITRDEARNEYDRIASLAILLEGIYNASGYTNIQIDENKNYENNYDKYGLFMETEKYEFEGEDVEENFMRYVKQSLDTDKIDEFVKGYCVEKDAENDLETEVTETPEITDVDTTDKEEPSDEPTTVENPSTGVEEPIMIIAIIALGFIAMFGLRKKGLFNKI